MEIRVCEWEKRERPSRERESVCSGMVTEGISELFLTFSEMIRYPGEHTNFRVRERISNNLILFKFAGKMFMIKRDVEWELRTTALYS